MPMDSQARLLTKPYLVLLIAVAATLLWGSAFPCIKLGYAAFSIPEDDVSAKLLFAGWRFTIAGLLTILIASLRDGKIAFLPKTKWKITALLGLVQTTIQYLFFYLSLSHISGVKGSILNATGVFFAVILSRFAYREDKLTVRKITGCLIGFCGILAIHWQGDMGAGFQWQGEGFMLLAAVAFAVGSLLNKRAAAGCDAMTVTGYQLFLGGTLLLIAGFLAGGRLSSPTLPGVLLLGYMSVLSAVAFTLWTLLLKYNPVGKISVYHFLTPVFGSLLSAIFLKESLFNTATLLALMLVCAGIAVVNLPSCGHRLR